MTPLGPVSWTGLPSPKQTITEEEAPVTQESSPVPSACESSDFALSILALTCQDTCSLIWMEIKGEACSLPAGGSWLRAVPFVWWWRQDRATEGLTHLEPRVCYERCMPGEE